MYKIYICKSQSESVDVVPSSWFILNIKTTIFIKTKRANNLLKSKKFKYDIDVLSSEIIKFVGMNMHYM